MNMNHLSAAFTSLHHTPRLGLAGQPNKLLTDKKETLKHNQTQSWGIQREERRLIYVSKEEFLRCQNMVFNFKDYFTVHYQ